MYDEINVSKLIDTCDSLARRVITIGGKYHGSVFLFDQCMRAFTNKHLPAQAITFSVYLGYPVNYDGFARIDRDGNLTMWRDGTAGPID